MKKMFLVDELQTYMNLVGFAHEKEQNVIKYYLNKNLNAIFGKCEFEPYEIEKINVVSKEENGKKKLILLLSINGERYYVSSNSHNQTVEMKSEHNANGFKLFKSKNGCMNTLTYVEDHQTIVEYQNVNLEKEICDYQKLIYMEEGEEKLSNAYRMKPIGTKIKEKEIFNLEEIYPQNLFLKPENENTNVFSKLLYNFREFFTRLNSNAELVGVKTSYEITTIDLYLKEIFGIMEGRCPIEQCSRKKKIS